MALTGHETAYLTARAGCMRAGASRAAYTPRDTRAQSGSDGGPYIFYSRVYPAAVTYTLEQD